jgi:ribonuclease-3 family protein
MWQYPNEPPERLSSLVLAYVGDAVFELQVRSRLVQKGGKINQLHQKAVKLVKAEAMAGYYQKLEPVLSENELEVLKRGRNAKSRHPRSADLQAYHMSTGFEALIGYLFLSKQEERLDELFVLLFTEDKDEHDEKQ